MEMNKENLGQKVKTNKTKIPLPVKPLPPLPNHLLNETNSRLPLKILAQSNHDLPKQVNIEKASTSNFKTLDARHVTLRKGNEKLDWDYKVFGDDIECVITISDDQTASRSFFNDPSRSVSVTPAKHLPIQHKCVRNVKRSLKRPHSQELQGRSPSFLNEQKEEDKAKRRLQFNESLQIRLLSPDYWTKTYTTCLNRDYTDENLSYLLSVEKKPLGPPLVRRITRSCVINWVMKVHGPFGNPATVQTACWFLDSILGTGQIMVEKLQLIAAACYWIAHKMQGPLVSARTLVKSSNNAFSKEGLLKAERAILMQLKFPTQPVVPHEFITYLAWYCDSEHPGEIEVAATFLCMSGLMVAKELCLDYPSVIACAAVWNALYLLQKKEMMKLLICCPQYQAVVKKSSDFHQTCSLIRKSVRVMSDEEFMYKTPLEQYGVPPNNIAQKIIAAVFTYLKP